MATAISESRKLAYAALERIRRDGAFANDVIDKMIDSAHASNEDKAYSTRLVLGVVSTSGSLDAIINRFVNKPGDIKGKLRSALRIAAYEIIYLGKDSYAAVDQCVRLVKKVQARAAGLANAVMRKVADSKPNFPYGEPSVDMGAYALLHAFPEWLIELVRGEYNSEDADSFVKACNCPSPVYVHVSSLDEAKDALERLAHIDSRCEKVSVEGIDVSNCLRLSSSKSVASKAFLDLVQEGKVLVSDASAQLISQLACENVCRDHATKNLSCLEICAGRGTKTILLQSAMNRISGKQFDRFIAVDNMEFKTKLLLSRARSYGIHVDESFCGDAKNLDAIIGKDAFDLVFLDAPCSGLGTMRRHPEIRWRVKPNVINANAALDYALLVEASRHVKENGCLVYSTCTITSEENEQVVFKFLDSDSGSAFEQVSMNGAPFLRTKLRIDGYDAHFCSILRRKALR